MQISPNSQPSFESPPPSVLWTLDVDPGVAMNVEPSFSTRCSCQMATLFGDFSSKRPMIIDNLSFFNLLISLQCFCFASRSTTPRRPFSWGAFCKPTLQTRGWKKMKKIQVCQMISKHLSFLQLHFLNHFETILLLKP